MTALDLFRTESEKLRPILKQLEIPVRAIVLPLVKDPLACEQLWQSLERHVLPLGTPAAIWPQNKHAYHSTLWHASPHQVRHLPPCKHC